LAGERLRALTRPLTPSAKDAPVDELIIERGYGPYKPRRCCECGARPSFRETENGPAWVCECGAYATVAESRALCGRTAYAETHALRREVLELFGVLCEDIRAHYGCSPVRARQRGYRMGSAILRRYMSFRLLSANQARKLIEAWSTK